MNLGTNKNKIEAIGFKDYLDKVKKGEIITDSAKMEHT